ncbi:zinc-dependent metalloprotease [bacterium AH-315-J21]|nr:zinc-dependent metalloprotease [bacterium AH-315-J21]
MFTISSSAKSSKGDKEKSSISTITKKVADATKVEGFYTYYYNPSAGQIWLQIDNLNEEFLYVSSLRTGLGSNPVGLDRGQLGGEHIVKFVRFGPKVLLLQPNLDYRADTDNPAEKRAVEESFAQSVLWGGEIVAEENGTVLVDISDFLLRDAHDVIGSLSAREQGSFSLDKSRSAIDPNSCKSFPRNTEFEALLTFSGSKPGPHVRETTPSPNSVSLRQHHSFVMLPDDNYTPRKFDPRAGVFAIDYLDFATPLDESLRKRLIVRHRLNKQDPSAEISDPIEPIIYYIDPGAPEPVRSALLDGASWWEEAFRAAGFSNAFRVEVLPDTADALDVRYNVIQWVHRSTRGWSYGGSVIDPRTGEIIKGHVSLGSLRVRQDRLLVEGLAPLFAGQDNSHSLCEIGQSPTSNTFAQLSSVDEAIEVALARIRQLSAHEVGHTLGLAHNFAASTYNRQSVMDYPAPLARIVGDTSLDLSEAYSVGIGEWDKIAIRYAYTDFPAGLNEDSALGEIINESIDRNLLFITDAGARASGSSHPLASLWDNGADPIAELSRMLAVRKIALNIFGENNLRNGEPLSELQNTLAPLYLSHRFQIAATAKSLGGLLYTYKLRGDSQPNPTPVSPQRQREALAVLLETLTPEALSLPKNITSLIPPSAYGYGATRETFPSRVRVFDPLSIAEIASRMTIKSILQFERAGRMQAQHQANSSSPSFKEALELLGKSVWSSQEQLEPPDGAIKRVVQRVLVEEIIKLASNEHATNDVKALSSAALRKLENRLQTSSRRDNDIVRAHRGLLWDTVTRFLSGSQEPASKSKPLSPPPGSPIGQ